VWRDCPEGGYCDTCWLSDPWVTEVVAGVEGIPCRGLLQQMLAGGALVYQSHSGRYCAEGCMALTAVS